MCAFCVIFSLSSFPSPVKLYPKRQLQSRSFSTSANLPASRHSIMPSLPLSIFLTQSLLGSCLSACLSLCLPPAKPHPSILHAQSRHSICPPNTYTLDRRAPSKHHLSNHRLRTPHYQPEPATAAQCSASASAKTNSPSMAQKANHDRSQAK